MWGALSDSIGGHLERCIEFTMAPISACRSASTNSSWKVRVSLYQTETRVEIRKGNARE